MDSKDLSALSLLLDAALDLPDDAARAAWLAQLAGEHERLKPDLERLLRLRAQPLPGIDERPALSGMEGTRTGDLQRGAEVGPYRLVRAVGRGGMSEVWLAESTRRSDPPLVALKLPAVSLDRQAFLARFAR